MPVLGIGVDVVHVPRIVSLMQRGRTEAFAARILSPQETRDWKDIATGNVISQARFLAVR